MYTQRDFTAHCKKHGFQRLAPHYYARCVGDGIFQYIYTGHKKYLDPESPLYSSAHRKSNYIGISIESMYTNWGNELFQLRNCPGKYEPCDFMGIDAPLFNGIEDQFTQMIEYGLDILDGINTQEAYLQLETKPQRTGIPHRYPYIAPYFLCGEIEKAYFEICHHYLNAIDGFFMAEDKLLRKGEEHLYVVLLQETKERQAQFINLFRAMRVCKYDYIIQYLEQNFEQNVATARKNGIPFSKDFHMRDMPAVLIDGVKNPPCPHSILRLYGVPDEEIIAKYWPFADGLPNG